MSEHGHDEHGGHDAHDAGHAAPSDHADHGGHDDHGHGGEAGNYNTLPPGPSTLPPVPAWGLAVMGAVLALLMTTIVYASLALANAGHVEASETHGGQTDKKAEH